MRELLQDILPTLLLLQLVHPLGDEGNQATPPHAGPAGKDVRREGGARMMDELSGRVQTLAAMAQEARGVGLGVEVEEKRPVHHCQASVEDVEAVLQLVCENKWEIHFFLY